MELYYIKFYDSSLHERVWTPIEKAKSNTSIGICEAAGFLLDEDDKEVKLTIAKGEENILDVLSIPVINVISKVLIPSSIYKDK